MNMQAPLEVGRWYENPDSRMRFHVDTPGLQWVDMLRASFLTGSESVKVPPDLPVR